MSKWEQFLLETLGSQEAVDKFQILLAEWALSGQNRLICVGLTPGIKRFLVNVANKHDSGATVIVYARDEEEAEVMALNTPACAAIAKTYKWGLPCIMVRQC